MLAVASWGSRADACSPPPQGWFGVLETASVPADGFVILTYYCYVNCESPFSLPAIRVREQQSGAEVGGSVRRLPDVPESRQAYAWRADGVLATGIYEIDFRDFSGSVTNGIFEALPVVDVEPEGLTVSATPYVSEVDEGALVCCPSGPVDTCGDRICNTEKFRRSVEVAIEWTSEAAPAHWAQYLHRVTWDGVDEPASWLQATGGPGRFGSATFDTPREEYCYTLELKSLRDGSVLGFERDCVEHPEGVELGVFAKSAEQVATNLSICEEPPAGHAATWCDARRDHCAENGGNCSNLEELCDDGGGCTVSGTTGRPGAAGALALLTGLLVARRRRRGSSA